MCGEVSRDEPHSRFWLCGLGAERPPSVWKHELLQSAGGDSLALFCFYTLKFYFNQSWLITWYFWNLRVHIWLEMLLCLVCCLASTLLEIMCCGSCHSSSRSNWGSVAFLNSAALVMTWPFFLFSLCSFNPVSFQTHQTFRHLASHTRSDDSS